MRKGRLIKQISRCLTFICLITLTTAGNMIVKADEFLESAAAAAGNLILNSGFEAAGSGTNVADKWSTFSNTNTVYSLDSSVFHSGGKSLKISTTSSGGANQVINVEAGKSYRFGLWIKADKVAGKVRYRFRRNGVEDSSWQYTPESSGTDWTYTEKAIEIPADAQQIKIEVYMAGQGTVWFDDVSFLKLVPLEAIGFESGTITMDKDQVMQVPIIYTPEDATNKNVTLVSSNTKAVKLEDGKLVALNQGASIITAWPEDTSAGAVKKELYVKIGDEEVPVTGISLDKKNIVLTQGESVMLNTIFIPDNTTNVQVQWSTSNGSVASVDSGLIKAAEPGMARITVTTQQGGFTDYCDVEVKAKNIVTNSGYEDTYSNNGILLATQWSTWVAGGQPPLNFSLDSTNKYSGNYSIKISSDVNSRGAYTQNIPALPGKTYKFSIYVKTEDIVKSGSGDKGADVRICAWKADGSDAVPPVYVAENTLTGDNDWTLIQKVITIPENAAKVGFQCYYGVAKGSAWFDEAKAEEYIPVEGLELSSGFSTVKVGESVNVSASVIPDNANNKNIIWTSENPEVASVSGGRITGVAEGSTTIIASAEEGGIFKKIFVYVSSRDIEVLPSKTYSFSVDEDGTVNAAMNKVDEYGNPLTYTIYEYAVNGLVRVSASGDFVYSPNKNYFGEDTFTSIVTNGQGGMGIYDTNIIINPVNDFPRPGETTVGVTQGDSVSGKVTAVDEDNDSINYAMSSNPMKGTVSLNPSGDFTYRAYESSTGADSFEVIADDGKGGVSSYKVDIFIAPKGENIISTLKAVSPNKLHPRINGGKDSFDNLKLLLEGEDTYISKWFNNVKSTADTILTQPPKEYEIPDGLRLLDVSREVLKRSRYLSMTYLMTGDSKYAERLWEELNKAGSFKDWNSSKHFLDTAEMTNAFGIAYDWLYDYWSPERKSFIVKAIKEKGLLPGINAYNTKAGWTKGDNNWNGVCNGGLTVGALAVADESDIDPEIEAIAAAVLENAVKGIPYMLKEYKPDGAWNEGPGYWDYGTSYTVYMLSSMFEALSTDYGLSDLPCMDITTDFPIYNNGAKGSYNFADAGSGIVKSPIMLWFGTRYNNPAYYWTYREAGTDTGDPLSMLWYPGSEKYTAEADPEILDKKFGYVEVGTMRSNWYDSNGTFLGFKGGYNQFNHGDLDQGSFIYDAYGVRWAMDLGSGDYNSAGYWDMSYSGGRWKYYRKRAEGHNTLVINPGDYPDQNIYARAKIERFETNSNQTAAMSIVDLSETYNKDAFSAKRGLSLTNNKRELLVQDEVRNRKPSDYWWFMHTNSVIDISSDGKSAILTNQGKRLYVQILSDEGTFSVMDAVSLPTSPVAVQVPNSGIKKLVVHLEEVLDVNLAVRMVPLMSMDQIPSDKPAVVNLNDWQVKEETPLFIDGVSIAGKDIQNFDKYNRSYRVILPYGVTEVPTVEAKVNNSDVNVGVELPGTVPGIAKITVTSKINPDIESSYYIELVPDKGITASTAEEGNWPENSMDGDLITRWAAEGDQWIQYYVGEGQAVEGISVAYFRGDERKYKFDILISEDGENWESVFSGLQTTGTTSEPVRYDFPEAKAAKYVRIFGHGSDANRWNNVAEVNIHKHSVGEGDLIAMIDLGYSKGYITNQGIYNSLLAKLKNQSEEPNLNRLKALKNEIEAQKDKKIEKAFADMLIKNIDYVIGKTDNR